MGDMNFYNLVKINKKESVREMPEISKPTNTMCQHCLHGKKTRTEFRTKKYSTIKSFEIVHNDLCRPMRKKGLNGEQYFMLLIYYFTRMTAIFFLKKS